MAQGNMYLPYLSDNVFRLAGIGSASPLRSLRQAVKRVEMGAKVGIRPYLALGDLLGDSEVENLSQILQKISSDPTECASHRILWFFYWNPESLNNLSDSSLATQSSSSGTKNEKDRLLAKTSELIECVEVRNHASQIQKEFISCLLRFIIDEKANHLKELLEHYYQFCECCRHFLTELIVSDYNLAFDRAQEIADLALYRVAEVVLNTSIDISTKKFSENKVDEATSLIKVIVHSPLDDDWEDVALRRISQYADPIAKQIEDATRNLQECDINYANPYSNECQILLTLASLLKGRVTYALSWESTVQNWIDKIAIAKANRVIARLNTILEMPQKNHFHDLENPNIIPMIGDSLLQSRKDLESISRSDLSIQAKNWLNQRIQEIDQIIVQIKMAIEQILRVFALQSAEIAGVINLISSRRYVLRPEGRQEISQRTRKMLDFLNALSNSQIGTSYQSEILNLKKAINAVSTYLDDVAYSPTPYNLLRGPHFGRDARHEVFAGFENCAFPRSTYNPLNPIPYNLPRSGDPARAGGADALGAWDRRVKRSPLTENVGQKSISDTQGCISTSLIFLIIAIFILIISRLLSSC